MDQTLEKHAISNLEYLERVTEERDRGYALRFEALFALINERDRQYETQFKSIEALINERDRQYEARFRAAEIAVNAALVAQEKSVSTAFLASEKAVLKAEQAQKEYNERSNEFRGQLDDQAKTLMPRPETLNMFKAIEEKVAGVSNVLESKVTAVQEASKTELNGVRATFEKAQEATAKEIVVLREFRSSGTGQAVARREIGGQQNWLIGIVISLMAVAVSLFAMFYRKG